MPPNKLAQNLSTKILGIKVDPNVSNLTILSTKVEAFLKLLLKDCAFKRDLNLLLSKFANDWLVFFDIGDDVRSIKGYLPREDR